MTRLFLPIFYILLNFGCSRNLQYSDFTGKTYTASDNLKVYDSSCEGCNNPGSIEFIENGKLRFYRSGLDYGEDYQYRIDDDKLIISSKDYFTVSNDKNEIIGKDGIKYLLKI